MFDGAPNLSRVLLEDPASPGLKRLYILYYDGAGITPGSVNLLKAEEFGKALLHGKAYSAYLSDLKDDEANNTRVIADLEAGITGNKDV